MINLKIDNQDITVGPQYFADYYSIQEFVADYYDDIEAKGVDPTDVVDILDNFQVDDNDEDVDFKLEWGDHLYDQAAGK